MNQDEINEEIHIMLKNAKPTRSYSLALLNNMCKEKGITEKEIEIAINKLMKSGDAYIIPESIVLTEDKITMCDCPMESIRK